MSAAVHNAHLAGVTASEIGADSASWIKLFPRGRIEARDGRRWTLNNPEAVAAASMTYAGSTPIAIDYDHQADRAAQNGQPAPAAGWITKLDARTDGLWGRVEWTDRAAEHLHRREYRGVSPTFYADKAGNITLIIGAGLTNRPALELPLLAQADPQMSTPADAALTALRTMFGLPADASPDAVVEAARTNVEKATAAADPTRFVPIETFELATAELHRLSAGVSAEAAVIAVERDVASGRLMPFMRDWAVGLCTANKPAYDGFVERSAGVFKSLATSSTPQQLTARAPDALDEEIARNLGISAQDMKA